MRLYFHLRDKHYMLPDVDGVEVSDIAKAWCVAREMIRTLRQEDPSAARDWSGWTLSVVDPAAAVSFTINLDSVA